MNVNWDLCACRALRAVDPIKWDKGARYYHEDKLRSAPIDAEECRTALDDHLSKFMDVAGTDVAPYMARGPLAEWGGFYCAMLTEILEELA